MLRFVYYLYVFSDVSDILEYSKVQKTIPCRHE